MSIICVYIRDFGPTACTVADLFRKSMGLRQITTEFYRGFVRNVLFFDFICSQKSALRNKRKEMGHQKVIRPTPHTKNWCSVRAHCERPLCCCCSPPPSTFAEENPLRNQINPNVPYFFRCLSSHTQSIPTYIDLYRSCPEPKHEWHFRHSKHRPGNFFFFFWYACVLFFVHLVAACFFISVPLLKAWVTRQKQNLPSSIFHRFYGKYDGNPVMMIKISLMW